MATRTADVAGSPWAFIFAVGAIVVWALLGPRFQYSDAWQLVINTGTTIVTFLMVFLIQNLQNRDARAMHLKLDELLRAVKDARTQLVNLENMTDDELDDLQKEFAKLHERATRNGGRASGRSEEPRGQDPPRQERQQPQEPQPAPRMLEDRKG